MGREVNTIGSKANDAEISRYVVEIKKCSNASASRSRTWSEATVEFSRRDAETQRKDSTCDECDMHINEISGVIVDAAMGIHRELGPGLLESVYEVLLAHELKERGLQVERQVPVSIQYRGIRFEEGYRLDLLENLVVIEVKSVELSAVHKKQLLSPTHQEATRSFIELQCGPDEGRNHKNRKPIGRIDLLEISSSLCLRVSARDLATSHAEPRPSCRPLRPIGRREEYALAAVVRAVPGAAAVEHLGNDPTSPAWRAGGSRLLFPRTRRICPPPRAG